MLGEDKKVKVYGAMQTILDELLQLTIIIYSSNSKILEILNESNIKFKKIISTNSLDKFKEILTKNGIDIVLIDSAILKQIYHLIKYDKCIIAIIDNPDAKTEVELVQKGVSAIILNNILREFLETAIYLGYERKKREKLMLNLTQSLNKLQSHYE